MGSDASGKVSANQVRRLLARKNQSSRAEREHLEDSRHHQHEDYRR
jgi:hypothetical protein